MDYTTFKSAYLKALSKEGELNEEEEQAAQVMLMIGFVAVTDAQKTGGTKTVKEMITFALEAVESAKKGRA